MFALIAGETICRMPNHHKLQATGMKFEKVALTRSWKSPVLTVLAPGDDKVRSAIARDPEFAAKAGALPTARH